jgi:ribosomal protein S18 acetylase RimI-like enzyme
VTSGDTAPAVRRFTPPLTEAVVSLWRDCDLTRPWNDPYKDIARKLTVQPELFLVAVDGDVVVGTIMGGYDGHRGWINYLAVAGSCRRRGIGRLLVAHVEEALKRMGCPKINLQVRESNREVAAFYRAIGFSDDAVVSLGKRLVDDGAGESVRRE